jgi:hypothetical protein
MKNDSGNIGGAVLRKIPHGPFVEPFIIRLAIRGNVNPFHSIGGVGGTQARAFGLEKTI